MIQTPKERDRTKVLKRTKVSFTAQEDQQINYFVNLIGTKKWTLIAKHVEGRTAKQCRDRYMNYLKPGLSNIEWTQDEDNLLLDLYSKYGPKWSTINKYFKNRNQTSLKNRFRFLQRYYYDSDQRNENNKKKPENLLKRETNGNFNGSFDEIFSFSNSKNKDDQKIISVDSNQNPIDIRNNGFITNFQMIIGSDEDFSSFSLMNSDDDLNF